MKFQIREDGNLDFDEVVSMFYEVGMLKYPHKREVYKQAIEKAFRNSDFVVSAWDGKKLIGFARVLTDKALFATIWNMIVKPEYQRQGIGRLLMERCLQTYTDVHFFLIADKEVKGFYEKLGFKQHSYGMYWEEGKKVCVIYN